MLNFLQRSSSDGHYIIPNDCIAASLVRPDITTCQTLFEPSHHCYTPNTSNQSLEPTAGRGDENLTIDFMKH